MDADKHSFLVSAIAVSPHDASRVMKAFKKATKCKEEPKGSLLSSSQRLVFFEILSAETDHHSVTVSCSNTKPLGKWARLNLPERDVFSAMLAETCLSMPSSDGKTVNIISDSGRYQRNIRPAISHEVCKTLSEQLAWNVNLTFADSRSHDGIQLADIIGNTLYQILKDEEPDLQQHALCGFLAKSNRLILKTTTLNGKKPVWL